MSNILITGATGYLGSRLAKHFSDMGYNVIALALNSNEKALVYEKVKTYYLSEKTISQIFELEKVDIVIHTATLYGRNQEQNIDMLRANVEFPVSVLQEAIKHNCELFINTDTILNKNISPYAMCKSNFFDWLNMYSKKIKVANLKLDHFYGPNDKPVKFIAWLIEQFKNNTEEINLTAGTQIRDFIYIDDVISAFECVVSNIENLSKEEINLYEVGSGVKTQVKTMVLTIKELFNNTSTKLNFGAVPYRDNEALDYDVDTSALRKLGWEPKVCDVRQGITKILKEEGVL